MDLRYPIGAFVAPDRLDDPTRHAAIAVLAEAPVRMREAVDGLNDSRLDTRYRPGGWTVREVVHHVPDSHLNAYVRFKLALTEDTPTIKPYDQAAWAALSDSRMPIAPSLALLEALHARWVALLKGMSAGDFGRRLDHPEMGPLSLDQVLALYEWHSRHHVAHITGLRQRMGW